MYSIKGWDCTKIRKCLGGVTVCCTNWTNLRPYSFTKITILVKLVQCANIKCLDHVHAPQMIHHHSYEKKLFEILMFACLYLYIM